jgi:hypothetical protein
MSNHSTQVRSKGRALNVTTEWHRPPQSFFLKISDPALEDEEEDGANQVHDSMFDLRLFGPDRATCPVVTFVGLLAGEQRAMLTMLRLKPDSGIYQRVPEPLLTLDHSSQNCPVDRSRLPTCPCPSSGLNAICGWPIMSL